MTATTQDTSDIIVNMSYYINDEEDNTITMFLDKDNLKLWPGITDVILKRGIENFFTNDLGFKTETYRMMTRKNPASSGCPNIDVKFVDEGIVMAKLQGFL